MPLSVSSFPLRAAVSGQWSAEARHSSLSLLRFLLDRGSRSAFAVCQSGPGCPCWSLSRFPRSSGPGTLEPVFLTCSRSEEHTSELQSRENLVCRLLLEKKKKRKKTTTSYIKKINSRTIN